MFCMFLSLSLWNGDETCKGPPNVSVVVPVFNRQLLVSICLNSLLNQSLKSVEVICVDDGSNDGSLQILNEFAARDKRVKVVHQDNCGVSCARNTGLKTATGEYVVFVDSDDWLDLKTLEIAYRVAKRSEVDVVVWGLWCVWRQQHYGPRAERILRGEAAAKYFLPQGNIERNSVCNKMYLRSMLQKNEVNFDMTVKFGEDLLFNLDVVPLVNTVYLLNKAFYYYNRSGNGLSRTGDFGDRGMLAESILRHLEYLKNRDKYKLLFNDAVVKAVYAVAGRYQSKKPKKKNGHGFERDHNNSADAE